MKFLSLKKNLVGLMRLKILGIYCLNIIKYRDLGGGCEGVGLGGGKEETSLDSCLCKRVNIKTKIRNCLDK